MTNKTIALDDTLYSYFRSVAYREADVLAGLLAANNELTAGSAARTGASLGAALGMGARSATYRNLYP